MFTWTSIWRNTRDHNGPRVANKGVTKHLRELAPAERNMNLVIIKSSNTLFKGQKTLIYFSSLDPVMRKKILMKQNGSKIIYWGVNTEIWDFIVAQKNRQHRRIKEQTDPTGEARTTEKKMATGGRHYIRIFLTEQEPVATDISPFKKSIYDDFSTPVS